MKLAGDLFYPEIRHPKMRLWGGGGGLWDGVLFCSFDSVLLLCQAGF